MVPIQPISLTQVNYICPLSWGEGYGPPMPLADRTSAREAQRLQTHERLLGAAIAEFKRSGLAAADVGTIVAAAGVAHGTFYFHFPTKEHVLLELEHREGERLARQLARFGGKNRDLESTLREAVRLVLSLEQRLGAVLFKEFLALHFSQTRPPEDEGAQRAAIIEVADTIERAKASGTVDATVNSTNSAVFFLLGLYALLTTTHRWPDQGAMTEDYLRRTLQSMRSNSSLTGQIH